eukprot:scaffold55350_cov58-Phaeocystis_antarctica.AAC.3
MTSSAGTAPIPNTSRNCSETTEVAAARELLGDMWRTRRPTAYGSMAPGLQPGVIEAATRLQPCGARLPEEALGHLRGGVAGRVALGASLGADGRGEWVLAADADAQHEAARHQHRVDRGGVAPCKQRGAECTEDREEVGECHGAAAADGIARVPRSIQAVITIGSRQRREL